MRAIIATVLAAVALAGCIGTSQPTTVPLTENAEDALAPVTDRVPGLIMTSFATPVRSFNFGGDFSGSFEHTENITGFVLEVEWDANSDFTQDLALWVRPAGVGAISPTNPNLVTGSSNLAEIAGPSPLRLVLPAADFPEAGGYEWVVRATADPVGVGVQQTFLMHFTAFDGVAFDEAFTDLPPPEEQDA